MAKIVRLKSHEQREWHQNQSMLVNDVGVVVRPVSSKEQMTMFQMSKHVSQTGQAFSTKTPDEPSTVEARLEKLPGSNKALIRFYIDNMEVRGGREIMKARMLAEHGSCQLRTINGRLITMVHDTRTMRTVSTSTSVAGVPDPASCLCARWPLPNGSPHPGKHHPVCGHNEKAPLEQRGSFSDQGEVTVPPNMLTPFSPAPVGPTVPTGVVQTVQPVPVPQPVPVAPPEPVIPAPEDCHCKGWALPNGEKKKDDVHHPVCEFKEKWESEHAEPYLLVDLENMQVLREATGEEIDEGEKAEATGGSMIVTIGEKVYGLMLESEVKEAIAAIAVNITPPAEA